VRVTGRWAGRYRAQQIILHTSCGRALSLSGNEGPEASGSETPFDFRAGEGESILDFIWSDADTAAAHAKLTGVVTEPDHVKWVGGRAGAEVDRVELGMRDGSVRAYGVTTGSPVEEVVLDSHQGEFIAAVRVGQHGLWRGALQFVTSCGRQISMPEHVWQAGIPDLVETFTAQKDRCIVGLRYVLAVSHPMG
jgi:hypothetical protein